TARELSGWQRAVRRRDSVFATVNISSRQLLRQDLIHDLRTVIARAGLARGTLKLELTEALVMENPEHTADAAANPRPWRGPGARRFRQRPLLARLPAALPVRHHQDRPVVRAHERQGGAPRGPALDHLARTRSRHGSGGRGRGNRFGRGRALSTRLRVCTGP